MTPSPLELLLSGRYRELYALLHNDDARGRLLAEFAGAADANIAERQLDMRASGDFSWGLLTPQQRRSFLARDVRVALQGPGKPDGGRAQRQSLARLRESLGELYDSLDTALREDDLDWLLPLAEHIVDVQEFAGEVKLGEQQYTMLLAKSHELASRELELHARLGLSVVHLRIGNYAQSQAEAEAAEKLCSAPGTERLRASVLHLAGTARSMQGDFAGGRSVLEDALALRRNLGEHHGAAATLGNLAFAEMQLGDVNAARAMLEQGRAVCLQLGDMRGAAKFLTNLGAVCYGVRDYAAARGYCNEALDIQRQLNDRREQANALCGMANAEYGLGELDAAREHHTAALQLSREIGEPYVEYMALNALGNIEFTAAEYELARTNYSSALEVSRAIGDRQGIARCQCGIANSALQLGKVEPQVLADALEIFTELGDQVGQIDALAYSSLYVARHDPSLAASALHTALSEAGRIGYDFDPADQLIVSQAHEALQNISASEDSPGLVALVKLVSASLREL